MTGRVELPSTVRTWGPPVLLMLLAAGYLWELLLFVGIPVARDMQAYFIPQKYLLWEALRSGHVPLWTPYVGSGAPFLASFQTGVFYPPHWAFAGLPFFEGINLLVAFHVLVATLFAWLFARKLGLARGAAFAAAAAWTFGGYFASLLNLMNVLQAAAWAPAIAYGLLDHLERRSAGSWLRLVAIGTLGFLAGEPQTFLLATLTAALAASLRLARRPEAREDLPAFVGGLMAAALAMAALTAVQVLPTLDLIGQSSRGGGGLSYGQVSGFPLEPIRLLHLLVPPDYGDPEFAFGFRSTIGRGGPWLFSVYLGPVWLLLLWFAWQNLDRRVEVAVWTAVGIVGVLLALGDATPVFRWLYESVPGVSSFRFAEKYFYLTGFAAMPLAGYGVEEVVRGRRRALDLSAGLLFLGSLLGVRIVFARSRHAIYEYAVAHFSNARMFLDFDFVYGVWGANLTRALVFAVLAVTLVALQRKRWLGAPVLAASLAGLLATDLLVAHRNLNPVVDEDFYRSRPLVAEAVPLDVLRTEYRYYATDFGDRAGNLVVRPEASMEAQKWLWQQTLAPNTGQVHGVLQADAWDAIKLRLHEDRRSLLRIVPETFRRWRLLRLSSVRYLYSSEALSAENRVRELALDPALPGHLYELRDPLPRAYLVADALRLPDDEAVVNAILAPDFDPHATVVLLDSAAVSESDRAGGEGALVSNAAGGVAPGVEGSQGTAEDAKGAPEVRLLPSARGETVRLRLEGPVDGFIVLTDSYHPGWRAYVDGEERPIERANYFFRAVPVEPGDREVVFRYRSEPFEVGRRVSLASLLLFGAGVGLTALRGRSRRWGAS